MKEEKKAKTGAVILSCPGCNEHPFQDKKYGNGKRVHSFGPSKRTCTVCGKTTKV